MTLPNPLIAGFNPDPSVVLADGAYYLVTSSFEYLPGIPVYRSTDLVEWTHVGNVATRPEQVEAGEPGHLDVEQDEVGLELGDGPCGVQAVVGLGDEADVGMGAQVLGQQAAGEHFVFGDEGAQGHGVSSGKAISTANPSGVAPQCTWARPAYCAARRSRRLRSLAGP